MKAVLTILTILAVAPFLGCASHTGRKPAVSTESNAVQSVASIGNADIHWDGTYLGLKPSLVGVSKELSSKHTADLIPALVEALKDKQRFVAAHVLLTELSGIKFKADADSWNGLQITLLPNGRAVIAESQQAGLIQQWKDWLEKR